MGKLRNAGGQLLVNGGSLVKGEAECCCMGTCTCCTGSDPTQIAIEVAGVYDNDSEDCIDCSLYNSTFNGDVSLYADCYWLVDPTPGFGYAMTPVSGAVCLGEPYENGVYQAVGITGLLQVACASGYLESTVLVRGTYLTVDNDVDVGPAWECQYQKIVNFTPNIPIDCKSLASGTHTKTSESCDGVLCNGPDTVNVTWS